MSDPQNPRGQEDENPTEAYPAEPQAEGHADSEQPTEAYGQQPDGSAQPASPPPPAPAYSGAVPGAPAQDPSAYPAPAYGAPQGTPPYGAPQDAAPYGAPKPPDTRPKTLGWIALAVGIATFLLAVVGVLLIFVLGASLVFGALALVAGLVGVVLSIVVLANRKQGNKGGAIGGLAASVVGGSIAVIPLIAGLIWLGLSNAPDDLFEDGWTSPAPSAEPSEAPPVLPSEEPEVDGSDSPATGDDAAYLAAVRTELVAIMQEVDPSISEDDLNMIYTDDMLILIGDSLLTMQEVGQLDTVRDEMVEGLTVGGFTEEQADRFVNAILSAAEQHLAG